MKRGKRRVNRKLIPAIIIGIFALIIVLFLIYFKVSGHVVTSGSQDSISPDDFTNSQINSVDNLIHANPGDIVSDIFQPEFQGYIVQLTADSLVVQKQQAQQAQTPAQARAFTPRKSAQQTLTIKNRLKSSRTAFKQKALKALSKNSIVTGKATDSAKQLQILGEYNEVFNGLALNITSQEAEKIKKIPGVKSVQPNYKVKILLQDSVPLINANDVWQLDKNGNNCATSGQQCLTGKGIKIGIIDTGVDYTHGDLGETKGIFQNMEKLFNGGGFKVYDKKIYSECESDIEDGLKNRYCEYNPELKTLKHLNTIFPRYSSCLYMNGPPVLRDSLLFYQLYYCGGNKLYSYNLDTKEQKLYPIDFQIGGSVFPYSIKDNYFVFADQRAEDTHNNVYQYNLQTNIIERITDDIMDSAPAGFYQESIIYYSFDGRGSWFIYKYDINSKQSILLDGSSSLGSGNIIIDQPGDVSEDGKIAYGKATQAGKQLTYFDLNDNTIHPLFINNRRLFMTPYISDNKIVYTSGGNIYLYDIILTREVKITSTGNFVSRPVIIGEDLFFTKSEISGYPLSVYYHKYNPLDSYSEAPSVFNSKVVGGYDFVNNDNDPMDDHGHGTHVAATAAGNGVLKGVAPEASIYAYKVLDSEGNGNSNNIIAAIERAADPNQDGDFSDHLDIISLSLGGPGNPDDALSQAIDNAVDAGVVAVVAAGNSGPRENTIGSPGTARKAITVGATDKQDNIAEFSSRGPIGWIGSDGNINYLMKPDVVAPGVDICAAEYDDAWDDRKCLDDNHVAISGTSMATPHVAGVVALIKQKHPDWTPEEIKMALRNTAVDLGQKISAQGYGRIDALSSVQLNNKPCIAKIETSGKAKGIIDIRGTASCTNLNRYTLYYGAGENPTEWTEITTSTTWGNATINSVTNGVLSDNFDTSLLDEGINYLKLAVENNDGEMSEDRFLILIDSTLKNGWPRNINEGEITGGINIGDINNDKNKEILFSDEHKVYVWNYDGSSFGNWPKTINEEITQPPATGDLNQDNNDEVFVSARYKVYAWKGDGSLLLGWPVNTNSRSMYSPTVSDINNDGFPEVVVAGANSNCQSETCKIYVFDKEGKAINGWPILIDVYAYFPPAVGDLDGDGNKEVIVVGPDWKDFDETIGELTYKLYVFRNDGNLAWQWVSPSLTSINSVPVIGDINNDGKKEIIISSMDKIDNFGHVRHKFRIFNSEGSLIDEFSGEGNFDNLLPPSLAQIDDDPELEVVPSGAYYYYNNLHQFQIFNYDGSVCKSLDLSMSASEILSGGFAVGDINNDGNKDLITVTDNHVLAFDLYGNPINGWPKNLISSKISYGTSKRLFPVITDLDNNNLVDIIVGSGDQIYVWELDVPYNPATMEWPMFQHDPQHTGLYVPYGEEICDGLDNDRDGQIDENKEIEICNDNIDNDCDGLVDGSDSDCCTPATCSSLGKQCGSGYDDGCGGTLDCGETCISPKTCDSNGQCVMPVCTDSDGDSGMAQNLAVKGTATDSSGQTFTDYCSTSSSILIESNCNTATGTANSGSVSCPSGQTCTDGACITPAPAPTPTPTPAPAPTCKKSTESCTFNNYKQSNCCTDLRCAPISSYSTAGAKTCQSCVAAGIKPNPEKSNLCCSRSWTPISFSWPSNWHKCT